MEISDIISPDEQKALDLSAARIERAKDAVTRAYLHQAASDNATTRAEVKTANDELDAACAEDDAIFDTFKPRLLSLARKALEREKEA